MKIYMKDGKALSYNKQFFTPKPTSETWVLGTHIDIPDEGLNYEIDFISNSKAFISLTSSAIKNIRILVYNQADGTNIQPYYNDGTDVWTDQSYRTITFLEPPTGDLLTWLNANGVKQ